jgi:putative ABC transport system substrate-binding protein
VNRRAFLYGTISMAAAMPPAAEAQQAGKLWRIGYLSGSSHAPPIDAFVQGLRDQGYVEGRNLVLEMKLAHGRVERIPDLAAELVRQNPHVIVAAANVAGLSAKKATTIIPIVVIASHDGVKVGLFASLARPGGNVTGLESLAPDLDVKRLEWLKDVIPTLSRVALLYNPSDPGGAVHVDVTLRTARALGVDVRLVEVRAPAEVDSALMAIVRDRPDALLTVTDPLVFAHRERIARFTLEQALPSAHEYRTYADFGGLMSYGPNMSALWSRAAYYVDRILKGARPGDLPVEQPTKFELVINLRTASALGLTIPPALLARADHAIE